ncbi:MAG: SH3 domain-containing protein [Bacillus sp. (in: Bacteria)]|nr:SH3 domain-containing protein [Bacillus sp. (in: firmicutes)]
MTATRLNVRDQASTSGRIISSLGQGTNVDLYEKVGQWYRVKINNSWGFVHGDFIKVSSNSGSGSGGSGSGGSGSGSSGGTGGGSSATGGELGTGEVTATRLNVRDQASTNGRIIGSLDRGVKVELHEKSGQWFRIRHNNSWGFIHSDFVRVTGGGSGSGSNTGADILGSGEVTASRLNVRDQGSTSGRIIGSLDRGTKVDLHEKVGQWYKIRISNSWGYIHSDFVQVLGGGASGGSGSSGDGSGGSSGSDAPELIGTGEVTVNRLNVRGQPNTSSSVVGTIERGTRVDLHEKIRSMV